MKRILCFLLAVWTLAALAGCGEGADGGSGNGGAGKSVSEILNERMKDPHEILLVQMSLLQIPRNTLHQHLLPA